MRIQLIFWAALFALGALVGNRYGVPGFITSMTDRGFVAAESWFGRVDQPIPDASGDDVEEEDDDGAAADDDPGSAAGDAAANAGLRINDAGLQIIKESESLRLEAYEAGAQWLIGYGHTRTAREGMTITETEADRLLREDVKGAEDAVKSMVSVEVNENQFSAMVSLAYNLGAGGFSRTTVLERINQGDYQGAADGFLNHDRARIDGELQSIPHLTERREKERALFLTPA